MKHLGSVGTRDGLSVIHALLSSAILARQFQEFLECDFQFYQ